MPEEIFIIVIASITIGGLISIVKTITNYMLGRQKKGDLTSGELSRMISESVDHSIRPLQEQVSRLERTLASPRETPRLSAPHESHPDDDLAMETRGRPAS